MIKLLQGDCLELMKNIPDGSVDLVLTDPPYGTTACKWDTVIDLDLMWEQLKRVTKPNGAIVMTASQPFTSVVVFSNIEMFRYTWIWEKEQGTGFLCAKKLPLKSHEDVLVFYLDEAEVKGRSPLFMELRDYFQNEKKKTGLSSKQMSEILGNNMAGHYFTNGVQWTLPTEDNYKKLQSTGQFQCSYKTLKEKYESIATHCRMTYNPQMTQGKKYTCKQGRGSSVYNNKDGAVITTNSGERYPKTVLQFSRDKNKVHPTQKPVSLMEYLIKTYTNEDETVLDFTMGSGTTGVACKNLSRNFIGIELSKEYYDIAVSRINSV